LVFDQYDLDRSQPMVHPWLFFEIRSSLSELKRFLGGKIRPEAMKLPPEEQENFTERATFDRAWFP